MTVPFMHAYTELLVKTCHRRGAHAMGGMSALIPSRRDPEANAAALEGVRADKRREAGQGFDGTWVAHPDLVAVATEEFNAVLGEQPNQVERRRDDVGATAADLLDVAATPGEITEGGLRNNVSVGIQYIASWLRGNGAAAINNLMEDAATAEIARSQIWQWMRHGRALESGTVVDGELVRRVIGEEVARFTDGMSSDELEASRAANATEIFEGLVLDPGLAEFLTVPAYKQLD
jgi:malate synthase